MSKNLSYCQGCIESLSFGKQLVKKKALVSIIEFSTESGSFEEDGEG